MLNRFYFRCLSTAAKSAEEKATKVSLIKRLNYENKALYGAVIRTRKKKVVAAPQTSRNETEFSSEIYWQSRNVSRIIETQLPPATTTPVIAQTEPQQAGLPTPFTRLELNSMNRFPLVPSSSGILEARWPLHEQHESVEYKAPSVNRVLTATMPEASRQALLRWKASKIAELGEEGFQQMQKEIFERGSNLHSVLELWLAGEDPPAAMIERSSSLWKSVESALANVERPAQIIEKRLYHPYLHYSGVVDCMTSIEGKYHVIEWKTSDNPKKTVAATYDAPIQLCAYLGALQASNELRETKVENGAIFVAYTSGKPANVHLLNSTNMRRYWNLWLLRLQEYWIRYRDGTLPEPI
ncbi:hypothetical protein AND_005906 [Anopheles darlingi]|uniref:Mitochondrial genome maintenance exonuclease 1 n=1 Tax=Anopheles darlingi TaxID=43151 RepID=W5JEC0_ANODA|nr:hypothetical protein AND_005906 [Anopheles darlingi]